MDINISEILDNCNINLTNIEFKLSYITKLIDDYDEDLVYIDELKWLNDIHRSEILHQIYLDVICLL